MEDVRATTAWVASRSSHVTVDFAGIEKVAEAMKNSIPKVEWDFEGIHYCDNGPLTVQYLLVLDALNFCFWPDKDLSYDHMASGLKTTLENDHSAFDADRLQKYTGPDLRKMLKWQKPLPLEDERVRLLHEVGLELERNFDGKASKLVESCGKSAAKLVALITSHFPGFRDHTLYKGHQVFLYKRAQIFVADLWGAFKGQGYGEFSDIGSITIFADYIVPAVLQQLGVLKYSSSLANSIETNTEIGSGSEEEVELRACSVYAVEKMRELITKKSGKQVLSVELDLWLWAFGIRKKRVRETHSKDIGSLDILSSVCSVIPSCTLNSATGSISMHQWLLRAGLKLSCRRLIAFFSGNHAGDAEVPRPKPLFSDGKFERHDDMPLGVLFVVVDGPPSQLTDYDACMHHLKQASRSLP